MACHMSPIKKLYLSELRRIKKRGIEVRSSRRVFDTLNKKHGFKSIGYFMQPNTIYIHPKIKNISYKLSILLHEEGHWLDKENSSRFLREYRAQRYMVQRAVELGNKWLIRHAIRKTTVWLEYKKDVKLCTYAYAAKKLMKTKLWRQLCQN
ncbi:hypothetical protein LCGC14_2257410 [marine sediment metagenome]|uniref:IrrE N-terminal-like domain-containing protein n=1 Tax=marine sediment metagenome TaxID=412755 RepID=A0A0F9FD80_9ZZZZ